MAYNKPAEYKKILEQIEKFKFVFIQEIIDINPYTQSTFFEWFPAKSDKMEVIKKALAKNRVMMKSSMRAKWYKSDSPALQIALYKLIGNEDERNILQANKSDGNNSGYESVDFVFKVIKE